MSFQISGLSQAMLDNLGNLGFTEPTPIQQ